VASPLFTGNVIALVWDFDQTLIPGYQQDPLFARYKISGNTFWKEVGKLQEHYLAQGLQVSPDTLYLNHILTYVQSGKFKGLTNALLKELGGNLKFYRGMPQFMKRAKDAIEKEPKYIDQGITVEHYIVSTGLRQMIMGSGVAQYVKGVWACEFIEEPAMPGYLVKKVTTAKPALEIRQVGYFLDNTTKTRAIWEINKGCNVDLSIDVNSVLAPANRRVPIPNMLYVADGPSDVPVFSILNQYGGQTMGVYNPASNEHYDRVKQLEREGRVKHMAGADYRNNSEASRWILATLREIADKIVRNRELMRADLVTKPVGHVTS
jgi:hypothetical protein